MDGLDLWVADQLRKAGKGTDDEARSNQHERNAQIRTGLEKIADKHATRLSALFHPAPTAAEKDKTAGAKPPDTLPLNVYFWKDEDGKVHLYDMTAPAQPREQTIDGPPTTSAMNTFFEDVVRYPEGEVRYRLPDGTAGVAPTTGTLTWYEWVGYAGLAAAALGLALTGVGAVVESALLSATATVCFAGGTLAGGISAGGHLADSVHLGTATTATVVLDAAQIAGSFASFGALSIASKAGGAAAALAGSRYFVPLVGGAAVADSVQLVALTDLTWTEMNRIQNGPGRPDDKQRAMAVLLTQLMVTTGLTALSVQGARNIRAMAKTPLELVDQNGAKVLRIVGDTTAETLTETKPAAGGGHDPARAAGTRSMHHEGTVPELSGLSHEQQVQRLIDEIERGAGGLRRPALNTLDPGEIARLQAEFSLLGGDPAILRFNRGAQTGFVDQTGHINVRGDVNPIEGARHPRSAMSSKAVLGHELGHRAHRGTKLPIGAWNDEFRASYWAAKNLPNLSDEERIYLVLDAMERAREAGVSFRPNSLMRKILYGY